MRDVKHTLNSVMTNEENRSKFCQIYQIDQSQKTLDRRMKNDIDDHILNRQTLRQLQRLMRKINFYVQAYKVVDQRILNFEHFLVEFQSKQHDFSRQRKDTHNKFIFHEVATVIILFDNDVFDRAIERDILIQSINDDFLRVLY